MAANVLYVVQGHEHPALLSASLVAGDLVLGIGRAPHTHWVYAAKTRYRQPDAACQVERVSAAECEVVCRAAMGGDARAVAGAL
jgi:tRNA-specific 2-thiouridylase